MRRTLLFATALCSALLLPSCGGGGGGSSTPTPPPTPTPTPATPPQVFVNVVATGFVNPLGVEFTPSVPATYVVEQPGTIRTVLTGQMFLDLRSRVEAGGEKGLLGLAFHPQFAQNRRLYVNYTRRVSGQLQTVISEFTASAASDPVADPATERILLVVNQPFENHNGGQLRFGPDGFLYIALGDGGSGGDPQGNAQNRQTLLGKMLRIDVNGTEPGRQYRIPPDNPFAAAAGLPEIWAYGLRNPWRFSFDASGRLFAGDVGQGAREEIDIITRGGNYGWNTMEGSLCFNPSSGCNQTGLILPIHDYGRTDGATVIGGFVYRGQTIAGLQGFYVFGDFISGRIWALRLETSGSWTRFELAATGRPISSFGEDPSGQIYVVDYSGTLLRLSGVP